MNDYYEIFLKFVRLSSPPNSLFDCDASERSVKLYPLPLLSLSLPQTLVLFFQSLLNPRNKNSEKISKIEKQHCSSLPSTQTVTYLTLAFDSSPSSSRCRAGRLNQPPPHCFIRLQPILAPRHLLLHLFSLFPFHQPNNTHHPSRPPLSSLAPRRPLPASAFDADVLASSRPHRHHQPPLHRFLYHLALIVAFSLPPSPSSPPSLLSHPRATSTTAALPHLPFSAADL